MRGNNMSQSRVRTYQAKYEYSGKEAGADIRFSPEFYNADNSVYSSDIACFSAALCMVGYDLPWAEKKPEETGIYKILSEMGMESVRFDVGTGREEVDGIFACLHTRIGGVPSVLVCACFVGSHHGQWYANFEAGTGKLHKGFEICEENEYKKLLSYIREVCRENERTVLHISGHSRGGATAGIIAKHLMSDGIYAAPSDVFAYTFAAPAYIRLDSENENVKGIFNFINREDFVVRCMPEKWGYTRYGTAVVLPGTDCRENYGEVLTRANSYYSRFTAGDIYYPFKNGTKAVTKVVNSICESVPDINSYYSLKFRTPAGKLSLEEYFQKSLCVVTAEVSDPEKSKPGTMLLLKSSLMRFRTAPVIRAVSDFFIIFEGLSGVVKGNLFRNYFSSTHDMCTYCALLMADTEKESNNEN